MTTRWIDRLSAADPGERTVSGLETIRSRGQMYLTVRGLLAAGVPADRPATLDVPGGRVKVQTFDLNGERVQAIPVRHAYAAWPLPADGRAAARLLEQSVDYYFGSESSDVSELADRYFGPDADEPDDSDDDTGHSFGLREQETHWSGNLREQSP